MPMDYDENDFHIHNVELAGEGSSTVLGPYDYEDSLQGQLRFDSLVENEVFLGITGQEDNQWIEEYSRGSSSSVVESRRCNNVWSEATSSESVKMLLKSVGQEEEGVLGETVTQELELELDASGSLAPANMDPNLKQDDGAQEAIVTNKPQENLSGSNESFKSRVTITTQSQEAKVSGGELDLVVLGKKCDLSVEKIDSICDDVNEEAKDLAVESSKEDISTSKVECGDTDSTQKIFSACKEDLIETSSINKGEYIVKNMEISMDDPTGSCPAVETCTNSDEKPRVLESVDKSPFAFEGDIPVIEESTSLMPAGTCDFLVTEDCKACESSSSEQLCHGSKCAVAASPVPSESQELNEHMYKEDSSVAVEDANTKSDILASLESNLSSPSKVSDVVQIHSVEEAENINGKQATPTASEGSDPSCINTSLTTNACSSADLLAGSILSMDLVPSNNIPKSHIGDSNDKDQIPSVNYSSEQVNDEIQSSEQAGMCMDQDVTFNEGGNARLPSDRNDMDIEVLAAHLDSQTNVESTSSAEGCKVQGSEADMTIPVEQVVGMESDMVSSCGTVGGVYLHSGSVATDYEKIKEARLVSDGTCELESSQVAASMVDCASEGGALSVVGKSASPDGAGKVVHLASTHCASPVENIKSMMSEQADEANHDDLGCFTSEKMMNPIPCDSPVKVGDNVEAGGMQESMSGHLREAPLSLAECDDTDKRRNEESCSVSSLNTELSQGTKVTHEMAEGAIYENVSFPEVTEDIEGKVQSVSLNSDMKNDKSCTFEVSATAGPGQIDKGSPSFPAIRGCNVSTSMEGHCINSSSSIILDPRKPNKAPVTPQTPGSASIQVGNCERKTRRKSVGKESVKKGKETTPRRVEKSSVLLSPLAEATATCNIIQVDELIPKEKFECSITKPSGIPLVPTTTMLPDLNNATCIFHQPFTNNQQVQLRAQILVYGSLISGTAPEEPHMIAAFDGGRKTWEAAWHHKSMANTPPPPPPTTTKQQQQPPSDLKKDVVDHTTPDPGIKHTSTTTLPSKALSSFSPIGGGGSNSPLIPLLSPLWNMSTPSSSSSSSSLPVGFPSTAIPRLDYRQSFSPLGPYQTPSATPPWLSRGPFAVAGQWSPASTFNAHPPHLSAEAIKLTTPVKVSGGSGIKHTYSVPVVHTAASTVFTSLSVSCSIDSKSRKRKKVTVANPISVSSHPLMSPVTASPPIPHLPCTVGQIRIPFLVENQTDSVNAPVTTSIFSTSVTVSTPAPASIMYKSPSGRFLPVSSTHERPGLGDERVGNVVVKLLDTSKKVEEGNNVQAEDIDAAFATKTYSESRSIKRKKVTTSSAVNETPISRPVTASPVTYLPPQALALPSQGHSELAQNQTTVCSLLPTSVTKSTLVSESSPGRFPKTVPASSTHGYSRTGLENAPAEETLSKVKESKLQAENAALLAAAEVGNCQDVWSQLESQKNSGVVSDAEAKLMSSALSIAAAATVAKMAATAAKIASNVAEQARLMADEVLVSRKTENFDQSSISSIVSSHPNNATPASILRSVDHPNSIISAAREAARRRIEAASTASKHAENLDAIVKAAELAAEAVSQVGKIVALMGDSSGYLQGEVSGKNVEAAAAAAPAPPNEEEIQTMIHDPATVNQMIDDGSIAGNVKEISSKAPKVPKAVGVATETDSALILHTYNYNGVATQNTSGIWEDHNIKEGCLVEVYKEDGKYRGAWLAANVLSLKDEEALVCYTEIQSSGQELIKEWVALEVEGSEVPPRIRVPHPMTTMQFQGARKRCRTAVTDYAWSNGDRVDVWMHDCWREGVVMEPNKIDVTSLTVQFPAQGETSIVRSWHVRPTLIWKDKKWIEWFGLEGCRGSELQGEMPKEKRMKLGTPAVKNKRKEKLPINVDHVESRHEEPGRLRLSAEETCFNVGKTTKDENKLNYGLRKEGPRVIFGIPKPSKKQKFMDVSTHYNVADGSSKNKFPRYLKSQVPGWKTNDVMENQVPETKSRRKPPVPSFRKATHNSLISSKSSTRDSDKSNDGDSVENQTEVAGSSSKRGDAAKKKAFSFTPRPKAEHFSKRKLAAPPPDGKKTEFKDKSSPQVNEPRRSNRKIQPTSRLLEGLQSSLTISKIPSFSHASQRSHSKVTSKGIPIKDDRSS